MSDESYLKDTKNGKRKIKLGNFDANLNFDVFEHISNTEECLQEVKRVLKTGGYYLLATPSKCTNLPFEIIKNRSLTKQKEYHCSLHNYGQLKRRFKKNGFSVKFYEIPVVNEFFKEKIKKQFGILGRMALRIFNLVTFPYFFKNEFLFGRGENIK